MGHLHPMPDKYLRIVNYLALSFFSVVLIDVLFLHSFIKDILPTSVSSLAWYYIIFGLPHILASYVSYLNNEYVRHYKKELLLSFGKSTFLLFGLLILVPQFFLYFFVAYTLYHIAWQQLGLCRRYSTNTSLYRIWSGSGLLAIVTIALSTGGESGLFISSSWGERLLMLGIPCAIIFFATGLFLFWKREYGVVTTLIIALACTSILLGYPVIGIIMARLTHDISAFCIYIKHDTSFQKTRGSNLLYSFFHIPSQLVWVFLPIVSVGTAFILQKFSDNILILFVIMILSLSHYILESQVWKRGTLHRNTLG